MVDISHPGQVALAGSAERVPLPDGSVDAVVAGQAYHHWFDHPVAHAEGARLLRPGGTYAAIFNQRDESVPWVAALTAITVELLGGRGVRRPRPRHRRLRPGVRAGRTDRVPALRDPHPGAPGRDDR